MCYRLVIISAELGTVCEILTELIPYFEEVC